MVGTELHWRAQRQNTQKTECAKHQANVIVETVYSVLKIIGHHSIVGREAHPPRTLFGVPVVFFRNYLHAKAATV
jgi:hypothetical protein